MLNPVAVMPTTDQLRIDAGALALLHERLVPVDVSREIRSGFSAASRNQLPPLDENPTAVADGSVVS